MIVLYILLIIAGFLLIAISYWASERFTKSEEELKIEAVERKIKRYIEQDGLGEKEIELIQNKVIETITERQDTLVTDTEDSLSRISNEKIMALSDYSNEILAKIEKSHTEVVFLYDMLGEKERELKKVVADVNKSVESGKGIVKDFLNAKEELETLKKDSDEKKNAFKERVAARRRAVDTPADKETASASQANTNQADQLAKSSTESKNEVQPASSAPTIVADGEITNHNDKILKLHAEGKSILDIAKLLDLGQGEVQLVIELFRGVEQ